MMTFGVIVIFLGVLFLLKNTGVIQMDMSFWGIFWPLFLIFIGLKMVLGSGIKRYTFWNWSKPSRRDEDRNDNQPF